VHPIGSDPGDRERIIHREGPTTTVTGLAMVLFIGNHAAWR
jgi:hypothetical protein